MKAKTQAILLATYTGLLSTIYADTLVLTDGKTLYGTISAESPQSVTIDTSSGRFTFPRVQVTKFTRETPAVSQVHLLKSFLSQGKLEQALQIYSQPDVQAILPAAEWKSLLTSQLASTASAVSLTSDTAAIFARECRAPGTRPELLILAAALCTDHQQFETAAALLSQIPGGFASELRWPVSEITSLLDRIASKAIREKDGILTGRTTALAMQLPGIAEQTENPLAVYGRINEQILAKDYLKATVLFKPVLFLQRPELFLSLGEKLIAVILAAPDTDAILAALQSAQVTVIPYVDPLLQQRALKTLVTRLIDRGNVTTAQALADKTAASNADLGATLQHLVTFRTRLQSIPQDKPLDRYQLASWARSMGLLEESRALFLELRPDSRFTETVNLQITLIENAQAASALKQLQQLYDNNEFEKLKIQAAEFLRTSPPPQVEKSANDLLQLAEFQKWSKQKSSAGKAEAEFQQAERLVLRGEYDAALLQLNQIQIDRQDSAAASKAQNLKDRIAREKLRQSLTSGTRLMPPGSAP